MLRALYNRLLSNGIIAAPNIAGISRTLRTLKIGNETSSVVISDRINAIRDNANRLDETLESTTDSFENNDKLPDPENEES
jgi:hypothetical protein